MTPVIPLPDPEPPENEPTSSTSSPGPTVSSSQPSEPTPRRQGRRRRAFRRPRRTKLEDIVVPAPALLDREIPAGDTDEQGVRSKWTHVEDDKGAAAARLTIQNAAARMLDLLPRQIATELQLAEELQSLRTRAEETERELESLRHELEEMSPKRGDGRRAVSRQRQQIDRRASELAQIERLARDVAYDVNQLSQHIAVTPDRVYREVEIIVQFHFRDTEERAAEKPHLVGIYRTDEPDAANWTIETFERTYGKLPIPTREEIAAYVERLRAACEDGGAGR